MHAYANRRVGLYAKQYILWRTYIFYIDPAICTPFPLKGSSDDICLCKYMDGFILQKVSTSKYKTNYENALVGTLPFHQRLTPRPRSVVIQNEITKNRNIKTIGGSRSIKLPKLWGFDVEMKMALLRVMQSLPTIDVI
ncbi:hypothetical protein G9A89_011643 [Geosiphon pyriformis]|nr:hypothetical protein G9A89_011643 [Geosiphon pyriformis]